MTPGEQSARAESARRMVQRYLGLPVDGGYLPRGSAQRVVDALQSPAIKGQRRKEGGGPCKSLLSQVLNGSKPMPDYLRAKLEKQ